METIFIIKAFIVAALISLFAYLYRGVLKEKDKAGLALLTFTAFFVLYILILLFTYIP